ncbi:hypothetical protein DI272_27920 [Streptomyces sp. Act143]|uniref:hypothetical protein n=1 Tax=Streptomyces sp. Act143 TaxID=2200760 RepID=UPI000D676A0D|nr:hypothetical protein [Streptomyces sp. Act143]PWI17566.1 hypothetical protein DI272_27920 [Streptomyces sp. Act143]
MTWSAALPGAALRVLRTAAGRRALQVVLLVGGLFALGFLCGERATAAEGVPTPTSRVVASAPTPEAHPTAPLPDLTDLTDDTDDTVKHVVDVDASGVVDVVDVLGVEDKVLRPATEHVVGAVDGKVVQPVGDLVETVTDQLAEAQAQLPSVPPLSSLPSLPSFPSVPELPTLPEAPELPVVPELPGQTLPAPVAATPRPDAPADGPAGGQDSDKARTSRDGGAYGPSSVGGSPATGTTAKVHGHRGAAKGGYAPVHQAPTGDQDGVLGHRPGVDNGSPRHGDAQAASLSDRAPLRLVPGGVARTDADGTRERHRDIPVSPA